MTKRVVLIQQEPKNKRISLGLSYVRQALEASGYQVAEAEEADVSSDYRKLGETIVYAGIRTESAVIKDLEGREELIYHTEAPEGEGFYIETLPAFCHVISGGSATGALYGCLELAERIEAAGELPREIFFGDAPALKLRGPVVGLQLTKIEPPRKTYEYPITPSRFPWFYDRQLWQEFLDMMLKERCNVLYIWSGHPFSSLVKVPDYPEALEVTEEEFQQNQEIFGWLTEECDKRGIWVVLKFYNIHIPYPFAMVHNLDFLQSSIHPLVADYTKKTIIEFIKSFPHIGLLVCLGEALRGTQNKTDWFLDTILPAVKEGVAAANLKEEPPLILRGHDCDAVGIMDVATKQYSNLYTMWKYNGESLTSYILKGYWKELHQGLSRHGQPHILNIHVLANLEPFRYGAPSFIQKCVQAGRAHYGGSGIHLYPLFYWDWPYAADKAEPRIRQLDRDWLWYQAWFRYAWNPNRDPELEKLYWIQVMCDHFGCGEKAGRLILEAMEEAGECAPRILRRIGITEGNRQTMSLGMTMSQITHAKRFRPNYELWDSVSTPGEHPEIYVEREIKGEKHYGESPYDMVRETCYYAESAYEKIRQASEAVTINKEEFSRVITDIQAIDLLTRSYGRKVEAAMKVLFYKYTMDEALRGDLQLLEDARAYLEESLTLYRQLADLTDKTYLYANSMHTPQRKIPFGNGEKYGHWRQCLPEYEEEYANFARHVEEMRRGIYPKDEKVDINKVQPLPPAPFKLLSEGFSLYEVQKGNDVFTDVSSKIQNVAPELIGLTGIAMSREKAMGQGVTVKLEFSEDVQLLIGYFQVKGKDNPIWLRVPDLETNTHADDRGGLSVVYGNAVKVDGCPAVNVHAFQYEKGVHEIYMGTGAYAILGVVPADVQLIPRDADLAEDTLETLDWLYEDAEKIKADRIASEQRKKQERKEQLKLEQEMKEKLEAELRERLGEAFFQK